MVCDDTNWTALVPGWTPQVWTRTGELWELFNGYPNPNAPAVAVGQLLITNAVPGRVAIAYAGQPKIYQIHPDGTLWERNCPLSPWTSVPKSDWRQIGKRADWVSLWGSGTVAFGLTRDGTLWTWGLDPTGISSPSFLAALKAIQAQVRARLAAPTARFGVGGGMPGYQKEPPPLLRLVPESTGD